jgi:predicted DsbA family dithiol-disulfide isomerase
MTETHTAPREMTVDFVADVVCPWCYLGWARLKKTFDLRPGVTPQVRWRPYQLNPELPEEGMGRKALMEAKFGADPERLSAMQGALTSAAAEDGLELKFDQIEKSPNTNAAHRLIVWASLEGKGAQAAEAVMRAYWTEGRDIGDPLVLADIGANLGMDRDTLVQRFADGAGKDFVNQACEQAQRSGVQGVPFMIFADKVAVSGAHPPQDLVRAIDKALEEAA